MESSDLKFRKVTLFCLSFVVGIEFEVDLHGYMLVQVAQCKLFHSRSEFNNSASGETLRCPLFYIMSFKQ